MDLFAEHHYSNLATIYRWVDSIVFIRGGQYHTQVINQRGRTTKLGNQHTSVTETFLDQFGAEFKDNFFVEPFYQCNVSIRGTDSSLWYWGISDPMNYSATEPIVSPIALTMPSGKKFKKVSTGTNTGFNDGITFILALASDGTLWKYDKKVGTAGWSNGVLRISPNSFIIFQTRCYILSSTNICEVALSISDRND